MSEILYLQVVSAQLTIERLPDGSTAILDHRTRNVHSLNATATVAWEACQAGATLAEIRRALELSSGTQVEEAVAQSALTQLHRVNLIEASTAVPEQIGSAARRTALRAVVMAVPVVLTLALSEQRIFAQAANSFAGGNAGP
jgi:hypothetical protein